MAIALLSGILYKEDGRERSIPITTRLMFGRQENADIQIDDPKVSRTHVEIFYQDGAHYCRDLRDQSRCVKDALTLNNQTFDTIRLDHGSQLDIVGSRLYSFIFVAPEKYVDGGSVPSNKTTLVISKLKNLQSIDPGVIKSVFSKRDAGSEPNVHLKLPPRRGGTLFIAGETIVSFPIPDGQPKTGITPENEPSRSHIYATPPQDSVKSSTSILREMESEKEFPRQ